MSSSSDDESTPLCEEDATALRKLRDDDASGAIKAALDEIGADTGKYKATYKSLGGASRAGSKLPVESPKVQQQPDSLNDRAATTTLTSSQEQSADVKEALMNAQELLAKANGGNSGTCSGSCNCVVA